MKLGLWLAVGLIAWLWIGHIRRQQLRHRGSERPLYRGAAGPTAPAGPATRPPAAIEAIVACGHCGVHVPLSDAVVTLTGARFCCEAHRRLHPAA